MIRTFLLTVLFTMESAASAGTGALACEGSYNLGWNYAVSIKGVLKGQILDDLELKDQGGPSLNVRAAKAETSIDPETNLATLKFEIRDPRSEQLGQAWDILLIFPQEPARHFSAKYIDLLDGVPNKGLVTLNCSLD